MDQGARGGWCAGRLGETRVLQGWQVNAVKMQGPGTLG